MSTQRFLNALCLLPIAVLMGCASVQHERCPSSGAGDILSASVVPGALSDDRRLFDSAETKAETVGEPPDPTERAANQSLPEEGSAEIDALGLASASKAELPVGLTSQPSDASAVHDPWEPFNRRVHRFNSMVDRTVAQPVAHAYVAGVPAPVRNRVSNFFDNLGQPVTAVNAMLQGRVGQSAEALGRFLLNSTVGVAGLFDPATRFKMRKRDEDFGQTLGYWGWRRSRYIELPFLGPSTVRDVLGLAGDYSLQPLSQVESNNARVSLQTLGLVDGRARLMNLDSLRDEAQDDYLLVRDSWTQRRNFQIQKDAKEGAALPDYLKE